MDFSFQTIITNVEMSLFFLSFFLSFFLLSLWVRAGRRRCAYSELSGYPENELNPHKTIWMMIEILANTKTPNPNWTRFGGLEQPRSTTSASRLGMVREDSNAKPPRNACKDMPPPPARATISPWFGTTTDTLTRKITVKNEREEAFCVYRGAQGH